MYPPFNPLINTHYSCLHHITPARKCVFTLSSIDMNQHRLKAIHGILLKKKKIPFTKTSQAEESVNIQLHLK